MTLVLTGVHANNNLPASSGKSLNESRLTNAVIEGLNRIIRIVKNRASGFRSLQAFIDMIFLAVGDLDIPAQIPVKFRTI